MQRRTAVLTALILGVAGTIQYHSQQFFSGFDRFFGDRGDARGFAYFCEHWYQSILGTVSLLNPGIFYPTKRTLAYSDLLFGFGVPYSFFRALGFSLFTSVELTVILITFLSYCTAFFLLYKTLRFGLIPSCLAALFFAFSSPKFHQTTHLQLQYVVLLPLLFAIVISFAQQIETMTQKRAAVLLSLAGLILNLQLATTFYYAWYFVVWTILFLLIALIFTQSRRFIFTALRKFWPALLVSGGVFLLVFIPLLMLYLPTIRVGTWYRFDFVSEMIPDWRALLSMGDGNYVWGWFYRALMPEPRPATWGELMVGIGLVPSLVWIALTVLSIRLVRARSVGPIFLGIMILATSVFYLIGFKYGGFSPWNLVYQYFPGAGAIRAVSRYVIFLTLPMSIAFAYVLNKGLASRSRALAVAIVLVAAFGVFEQFGIAKINGEGFSTRVENEYLRTMAAKLPTDCAAFYVAPGRDANHSTAEYQYDAMMISIISRVKTLNASSSQFPPDWNMYFVKDPGYEDNVKAWINSRGIQRKVCRLEIGPEVEAFDLNVPNVIDEPEFFVRQLYRDFAGNEPAPEVVQQQVERIRNCRADDESCERAQVALNVFLGTGFHERGFAVLRMYRTQFGRAPSYEEFVAAMNDPNLTRVESDEFGNRAFVMLHYYGFLRRAPDETGVENWLELLNRSGVSTKVTEGFITSVEYRQRFR